MGYTSGRSFAPELLDGDPIVGASRFTRTPEPMPLTPEFRGRSRASTTLKAKLPTSGWADHEQCGLDSIEVLPPLPHGRSLSASVTDSFRALVAIMQRLSDSDAAQSGAIASPYPWALRSGSACNCGNTCRLVSNVHGGYPPRLVQSGQEVLRPITRGAHLKNRKIMIPGPRVQESSEKSSNCEEAKRRNVIN